MSNETFHPLVYFWIAFYKDKRCLPQFDIENGRENDFESIDQTKLDKFGLFPFDTAFVTKVNRAKGFVVAKESAGLSPIIMRLKENQRLIFFRRNKVHTFTFQHCDKCGYNWQWMGGHKEGEGTEVGLLIFSNHIIQKYNNKDVVCAQCPKCGSFNAIICPDCGTLINEMKRSTSEEHFFMCPKCKKDVPRYIKMFEDQLRTLVYIMGYQVTVDGKNSKQVMFIDENGIVEMDTNL